MSCKNKLQQIMYNKFSHICWWKNQIGFLLSGWNFYCIIFIKKTMQIYKINNSLLCSVKYVGSIDPKRQYREIITPNLCCWTILSALSSIFEFGLDFTEIFMPKFRRIRNRIMKKQVKNLETLFMQSSSIRL